MFEINVMSRRPVYEQLVDEIERFILTGVMKAGERIPSVRSLSVELSLNPNTIQKAFSELDRRGIVYSVPGKGSFVSPEAIRCIGERKRGELDHFVREVHAMALAGIEKKTVIRCVDEAYQEGGDQT